MLKEHLQVLERNVYMAMSTKDFLQFGYGPAQYLIEVCWHPTWESEARLCEHAPHSNLAEEYKRTHLECTPTKMHAKNIYDSQGARMQQDLDAMQAPCNVYHVGLKTNMHISLDPINPDFDIMPTGSATIQCQSACDCYAKEPSAEINK